MPVAAPRFVGSWLASTGVKPPVREISPLTSAAFAEVKIPKANKPAQQAPNRRDFIMLFSVITLYFLLCRSTLQLMRPRRGSFSAPVRLDPFI